MLEYIPTIVYKRVLLISLFCSLAVLSSAQPQIDAIRVENPPHIDGRVDDTVWNLAFKVDEFFQQEPDLGEPSSEKTEVYVCYDSKNIYFGIKCWDNPEKIAAKEMLYDAKISNDDRMRLLIDTYHNKRTGYYIAINPLGAKNDASLSNDGSSKNEDWDGIWDGRAHITEWGWEAEISIPFQTLGFDRNNDTWGIKFSREIEHKTETSYWPRVGINSAPSQLSDAGILVGLKNISQGIGLSLSPYLVTGFDQKKGNETDYKLSAGIDVSYQITPSLKTAVSVNTDFAETEVDNRQINLTRFNLHYPEKRNFFLDGANYFQFGNETGGSKSVQEKLITFFPRRMGLDTLGQPVPINYAAKFTGMAGDWNIGALYINDDREKGMNNFYVARVSRNFWKQSSIGFIGTYGNTLGPESNFVGGIDLKLATSTFGGDKNATLILFGQKSFTEGIANINNGSFGIQVDYPNDFIKANVGYYRVEKDFVAGMGFVPRTDINETFGGLTIGPRLKKYGILQINSGGEFSIITNASTNDLETREIKLQPVGIRFLSGDQLTYSLVNQYEYLKEDFNIFDDAVIIAGDYSWWQNELKLETKGARDIWGEVTYGFGDFYDGKQKEIEIAANWKIGAPFLFACKLNKNIIDLPEYSFTANVYQFNANILFSPNLTLYNFIQYDNESNTIGYQSRFRWILKPGNEILFVWNSKYVESDSRNITDTGSLRFKIKYNIRF
jgi:hypothetical protein